MPRPPPDRRRGRQPAQRTSRATPRNPARSVGSGQSKVSGTFEARAFEARRGPDGARPGASGALGRTIEGVWHLRDPAGAASAGGPGHPGGLEAYGAVRHEGRLADRALDHPQTKRHLYSNERRAVAERVYALLRRQRTVDYLLDHAARPASSSCPTTRQDLLRLAASRVLHGESPERRGPDRRRSTGGTPPPSRRCPDGRRRRWTPSARKRFPLAASLPDFLAATFRAPVRGWTPSARGSGDERARPAHRARQPPQGATARPSSSGCRAEGVDAAPRPSPRWASSSRRA